MCFYQAHSVCVWHVPCGTCTTCAAKHEHGMHTAIKTEGVRDTVVHTALHTCATTCQACHWMVVRNVAFSTQRYSCTHLAPTCHSHVHCNTGRAVTQSHHQQVTIQAMDGINAIGPAPQGCRISTKHSTIRTVSGDVCCNSHPYLPAGSMVSKVLQGSAYQGYSVIGRSVISWTCTAPYVLVP